MDEVRIDGQPHEVLLLGICEGLAGEATRMAKAIRAFSPDTVALALDHELTEGIDGWAATEDLGTEDAAYVKGLSPWGEVQLPPPEYPRALEVAQALGVPVQGVDLSEVAYLDLHTEQVSVWDLFKRSFTVKRALKGTGEEETAEAFCRAFDARVNRGAFARLEERRERKIAENVAGLAQEGSVVVVLPVARLEGVADRLGNGG